MTTNEAHNTKEIIAITDALNSKDAAAFGIEHQAELFTGTVRGWVNPVADFDAITADAIEHAIAKLSVLRERADAVRVLKAGETLGETAQSLFAACGDLLFSFGYLKNAISAKNDTEARNHHAIIMTGFNLDGSEV